MEAAHLRRLERVGAAARIKPRVPQRLGGINIADSGDSGLVEKELLQRAFGGGEEFGKPFGSKFGR